MGIATSKVCPPLPPELEADAGIDAGRSIDSMLERARGEALLLMVCWVAREDLDPSEDSETTWGDMLFRAVEEAGDMVLVERGATSAATVGVESSSSHVKLHQILSWIFRQYGCPLKAPLLRQESQR